MSAPTTGTSDLAVCELPTKSTTTPTSSGPKPCCVCKNEKQTRDECLLFSSRGEEDCKGAIDAYRDCMASYGFKLP